MKKGFSALFLGLIALGAQAQTDVEEWFQNERPEQIETVTVDETGTHRAPMRVGSQDGAPMKSIGTKRVPVVLVNFADRKFTLGQTDTTPTDEEVTTYYNLYCNGTMDGQRYTGHGSYGAIRDYFVEMSDSLFQPEFTIIGPVTLDNGYATYGKNSGNTKDVGFSNFRTEAMQKAVDLYSTWGDFDNDGNGTVDMVFFVYAGWGESNTKGLDPDAIWAKESTASITIGGQVFACSAVCHELRPQINYVDGKAASIGATKADGVGVFVHEFSHALGLPDFYDTNNVAFGMDLWSVMDYGEYGNNGYTPGNYTAYERNFMGWQELVELTEPQIVTLLPFAEGGCGYKITNEANPDEYYVLDNRQAVGWDSKIGAVGHGLQVTHVDYNSGRWNGNTVNTDKDHQRMTIIAANNNYNGTNAASSSAEWQTCLKGNLFPGADCKYDFTDDTDPAQVVYAGALMHRPIRNITENEDGSITLCYRTNGQLDTPEDVEADSVDVHSFHAQWGGVENAESYQVEYKTDTESNDSYFVQVEEPQVTIDSLAGSTQLKFRVMASCEDPENYLDSEWSEWTFVQTDADVIRTVSTDEQMVDVFTMGGACVSHCQACDIHRIDLRHGVYVLRYADGQTRKIMF